MRACEEEPMSWRRVRSRLSLPIAALLTAAPLARAGVLVVSRTPGPGIDFTQIQPAVNAAVDGDTILVRNGSYMPFKIDGKSLTVVADGTSVLLDANGT